MCFHDTALLCFGFLSHMSLPLIVAFCILPRSCLASRFVLCFFHKTLVALRFGYLSLLFCSSHVVLFPEFISYSSLVVSDYFFGYHLNVLCFLLSALTILNVSLFLVLFLNFFFVSLLVSPNMFASLCAHPSLCRSLRYLII